MKIVAICKQCHCRFDFYGNENYVRCPRCKHSEYQVRMIDPSGSSQVQAQKPDKPDHLTFYVETFGYEKAVEIVEKATFSPSELNIAECILKLVATRGLEWVNAQLAEQRAMLTWLQTQNRTL